MITTTSLYILRDTRRGGRVEKRIRHIHIIYIITVVPG